MTSRLIVNSIRHTGASADAITLDNSGNATFPANVTCSGTATGFGKDPKATNLVINGAMMVAQRGTSFTTHPSYAVDRFRWGFNNHSAGTVTVSQQSLSSSDTPYTLGFRKYNRMALGQAGTAAANTAINLTYKFEAQDVANSGWNYTSTSSFITISFWFRCSTNQTFVGEFQSKDGTAQAYSFTFTASGNNTWTKITKTIPGASNVQIDNDNGGGFDFRWYAFYGTDYSTSGHTLDQWGPYSSSDIVPDMASTWLTAGASTFDVTGVQLEVGDSATDFEHRSFADELARCQRYFQVLVDSESVYFGGGYMYDHYRAYLPVQYYVEMRSAPSFQYTSGTNYYSLHRNGSGDNFDGWSSAIGGDNKHVAIQAQSGLSGTGGHAGAFWSGNAASKITFEAEL